MFQLHNRQSQWYSTITARHSGYLTKNRLRLLHTGIKSSATRSICVMNSLPARSKINDITFAYSDIYSPVLSQKSHEIFGKAPQKLAADRQYLAAPQMHFAVSYGSNVVKIYKITRAASRKIEFFQIPAHFVHCAARFISYQLVAAQSVIK